MVELFTPNSVEPIVKVFAHNGLINSLDFSSDGNYIVTAGTD